MSKKAAIKATLVVLGILLLNVVIRLIVRMFPDTAVYLLFGAVISFLWYSLYKLIKIDEKN